MPRAVAILQKADEILALVDDASRDQRAKLLSHRR